jgi:hypothetical protein
MGRRYQEALHRGSVGLWVLVVSLLVPNVILFFWHDSITSVNGAPGRGFWALLASTFAFIGAVLSMGAPLWSRIQAVATWEAVITFPEYRPQRHMCVSWRAAHSGGQRLD